MGEPPRAVIVPFGVPPEARGLGLGLAALMHSFAKLSGGRIAVAQLCAPEDQQRDRSSSPVEAFLTPDAWREIAGRGDAPLGVGLVPPGLFEPPIDGGGTLRLLAFDPANGRTFATNEALGRVRTRVRARSRLDDRRRPKRRRNASDGGIPEERRLGAVPSFCRREVESSRSL